ncbi:MAG TPA: hypothetical protein VHN98_07530 [Acidimicrobiales bacterium]|nr:hypothetical protein [Acidimicrobiales bacterium]
MATTRSPAPDEALDCIDDLPGYLEEPARRAQAEPPRPTLAPALRTVAALVRALPEPREPASPTAAGGPPASPVWNGTGVFFRCYDVPGRDLERVVEEWSHHPVPGRDRRRGLVRFDPPAAAPGAASLHGTMRRFSRWHRVPVAVDLWAHTGYATCALLRPEGRVVRTRRYFRLGHRVLDQLGEELSAAAATVSSHLG